MEKQNEEQQELLYKFNMFEKQIGEMQQQIEAVERGIVDLTSLNFGLDEIVGGIGKEIFASVGKGIFVKAKLTSEDLNVDIGNGSFVKKGIPETKELISEQIKKLERIKEELEQNLEQLGEELTGMINQTPKKEHSNNHSH